MDVRSPHRPQVARPDPPCIDAIALVLLRALRKTFPDDLQSEQLTLFEKGYGCTMYAGLANSGTSHAYRIAGRSSGRAINRS